MKLLAIFIICCLLTSLTAVIAEEERETATVEITIVEPEYKVSSNIIIAALSMAALLWII